MKIRITSFWPGIIALAVATTLFCMPGQEFPRINWLDKIHFDKIAHIGLFSVLVFLWVLPPRSRIMDKKKINSMYLWIAVAFVAYGIAIEFIQLNFVAHRSFDFFDIVANTIGCAFGGLIARKTLEV